MLRLAVEHRLVGSEQLVERHDVEIDVPVPDASQPMGSEGDAVHQDPHAALVGQAPVLPYIHNNGL